MEKELIQLTCKLMNRAVEVSNTSKADIFVHYSPHIKVVGVRIFEDGWQRGKAHDKDVDIYLNLKYITLEKKIRELEKAIEIVNLAEVTSGIS